MNVYIKARSAGVDEQLRVWNRILFEPLSRLAAWLAPPKEN